MSIFKERRGKVFFIKRTQNFRKKIFNVLPLIIFLFSFFFHYLKMLPIFHKHNYSLFIWLQWGDLNRRFLETENIVLVNPTIYLSSIWTFPGYSYSVFIHRHFSLYSFIIIPSVCSCLWIYLYFSSLWICRKKGSKLTKIC